MKKISEYKLGEIREICKERYDCTGCAFFKNYIDEFGCEIRRKLGELAEPRPIHYLKRPDMWEV